MFVDCLNEDTDKVPLQTHALREFEQVRFSDVWLAIFNFLIIE